MKMKRLLTFIVIMVLVYGDFVWALPSGGNSLQVNSGLDTDPRNNDVPQEMAAMYRNIGGKAADNRTVVNPKLKKWLKENKTGVKVVDYYLEDGKWVPYKMEYKENYIVGMDDKGELLTDEAYQLSDDEQRRLNEIYEACTYNELAKPVRFRVVLGEVSVAWDSVPEHASIVHTGVRAGLVWFGEGLFRDLLARDVDSLRSRVFSHKKEHLAGRHEVDSGSEYEKLVSDVRKRCIEIDLDIFPELRGLAGNLLKNLYEKAYGELDTGLLEKGVMIFEYILKYFPDEDMAKTELARIYFRLGKYDTAKKYADSINEGYKDAERIKMDIEKALETLKEKKELERI